jgi:hypothetical protein
MDVDPRSALSQQEQEPEGGWQPLFDPHELAIRLSGTVVTLQEMVDVCDVTIRGLNSPEGAEPHNREVRWTRESGWQSPQERGGSPP